MLPVCNKIPEMIDNQTFSSYHKSGKDTGDIKKIYILLR
ncbi:hypothetical protein CHCC14814_0427 [Bacillus paralicheniformis]|nr:hypothetical protein CHCC14814_0427 [Bacillus paralicheniformis]